MTRKRPKGQTDLPRVLRGWNEIGRVLGIRGRAVRARVQRREGGLHEVIKRDPDTGRVWVWLHELKACLDEHPLATEKEQGDT